MSPQNFRFAKKMRTGALVADILLTGLLGVVVDALTGGWWNLEPDDSTLYWSEWPIQELGLSGSRSM